MNEIIYKLISAKYDIRIESRTSTEFVRIAAFHHDTKLGQVVQANTLDVAFQILFDKLTQDGKLTP